VRERKENVMREEDREFARYFQGYDAAFVLVDVAGNRTYRYRPDACARRDAPCSTFKIPNALIGLETGVLSGPNHRMKWDGIRHPIADWNRDHTLRTAFQASALWYFQKVAAGIGEKRMREWVNRLGYGNRDTSGGLTRFWLGDSLTISPDEQIAFLRRLHTGSLPFSKRTQEIVRDIMVVERRGDTVLRGKTGTGGNSARTNATLGWFVGYTTKGPRTYLFATRLRADTDASGRKAREITRTILRDRGIL
jgi:beta-lactamase class D